MAFKLTLRKAKVWEKNEREFRPLVDFSNVRVGSILTFIPRQSINPDNIMVLGSSDNRPKMYKLIVKIINENTIIGEVHLGKFETRKVEFDREGGLSYIGIEGGVVNKKFRGDYEFILQTMSQYFSLRIHRALALVYWSHAKRFNEKASAAKRSDATTSDPENQQ